jgi:fluoride exporter
VRAADVLVVWVGGTLGTAVRVAVSPSHDPSTFPTATFVVNLVGAGLLGLLVERLARRRPGPGERRLGLLLGTGFLGGFTTYSALAVDTVQLLRTGAVGLAVAYGLGTLVLGAVVTGLGIVAGRIRRAGSK